MAGDWIKITSDVSDKPEIHQMAGILSIDPDAVVGKLLRVWSWFDKNTVDGHAFGVTFNVIDRMTFCVGFGEAMIHVGWLEQNGHEMIIPRFERHNGETAKKRALSTKRKQKERSESDESHEEVTDTSRNERDKSVTREEKRREDINKDNSAFDADLPTRKKPARIEYSEVFESFWQKYPRNEGKAPAYTVWQKLKLDDMLDEVVAGLQWSIKHNEWDKDAKFCPHAQNWLKARRWEDAPKEKPRPILPNAYEIVTFEGQEMTRAQMQEIKRKRYEERTGYAR